MKASLERNNPKTLTTTEARQGGRQTSTFVVLVVALVLATIAGLAFVGVRYF